MSHLARVLKRWRWADELSVRQAAKIIGISSSTLCRIESGKPMDGATLATILKWLLREKV